MEQLLTDIFSSIKSAVSGTTDHVYFLLLPSDSDEILSGLSVTYELNNTDNEDTFDSKESEKVYRLRIKINGPSTTLILNNSIYIKEKVYNLKGINQKVKNVKLETEDLFFDHELEVYTQYLAFELKYS